MKIAIITDAWKPQVNGVVTTLCHTAFQLAEMGHDVRLLTPEEFRTLPCPTYPSIRLALRPAEKTAGILDKFAPHAFHIATEGPLGYAARRYCLKHGLPFSSSFHTRFPEYIRRRAPIPLQVSYGYLRKFHSPSSCTMAPTQALKNLLIDRGFAKVEVWGRGVDTNLFRPKAKGFYRLQRPISLYVGRVAAEKNIEDFLAADLPGSKVVVGDGPELERLRRNYPQAYFAGFREGEDLVSHIAGADVFVFPSRSDTFGLVMLEAMACGVPVAAYPVTGPLDVVTPQTGVLSETLAEAVQKALFLNPDDCIAHAQSRSWRTATEQFLTNLSPTTVRLKMPRAKVA